jgi:hypothetical protein
MNEKDKHEYCLLWQQARDLAGERGLDMQLTCPMEELCTGTRCVMIDPQKDISGIVYNSDPIIGC